MPTETTPTSGRSAPSKFARTAAMAAASPQVQLLQRLETVQAALTDLKGSLDELPDRATIESLRQALESLPEDVATRTTESLAQFDGLQERADQALAAQRATLDALAQETSRTLETRLEAALTAHRQALGAHLTATSAATTERVTTLLAPLETTLTALTPLQTALTAAQDLPQRLETAERRLNAAAARARPRSLLDLFTVGIAGAVTFFAILFCLSLALERLHESRSDPSPAVTSTEQEDPLERTLRLIQELTRGRQASE